MALRELGRWLPAVKAAAEGGIQDGRYPGAPWISPSYAHSLIESGCDIEALRILGKPVGGEPGSTTGCADWPSTAPGTSSRPTKRSVAISGAGLGGRDRERGNWPPVLRSIMSRVETQGSGSREHASRGSANGRCASCLARSGKRLACRRGSYGGQPEAVKVVIVHLAVDLQAALASSEQMQASGVPVAKPSGLGVPVVSGNSITTECADFQCVGMPARGRFLIVLRVFGRSDSVIGSAITRDWRTGSSSRSSDRRRKGR